MLDRERILGKLDELDGHLGALRQIVPKSYGQYVESVEKRRACERLPQISIECGLDVCLVHEYGRIDNAIVFSMAPRRLQDFDAFTAAMLQALQKHAS